MNYTKKISLSLIALLFSIGCYALPIDKIQANNILIRTNRVIGHAHMSLKKGGNLTGDFAKAVHHERVAKSLFKSGEYEKAIYHSRLARILATQAIKANKVKLPMDASFSPAEMQLFQDSPSNDELAKEADAKDNEVLQDKDLLNGNLGIDLI